VSTGVGIGVGIDVGIGEGTGVGMGVGVATGVAVDVGSGDVALGVGVALTAITVTPFVDEPSMLPFASSPIACTAWRPMEAPVEFQVVERDVPLDSKLPSI
jgi:hypothetical protein